MKKVKNILIVLLVVIIILICGSIFIYKYINRINTVELKGTNEELSISTETEEKSKEQNITNILLLGVDKEENASDTMIIFSLDKDTNTAKLISIMRDLNVELGPSANKHKINYAYNVGGVEESVRVVNREFDLDINKYVKVSFDDLVDIIDYIGGININITESERRILGLSTVGNVNLNGEQALSYSRIRSIDSDYIRTSRQRKVLIAIFNKAKSIPVSNYPKVISDLSSNVQTNLSTLELLNLGESVMKLSSNELEGFRIPIEGTHYDLMDKGIYYLGWDKEKNKEAIHEFIYGENSN